MITLDSAKLHLRVDGNDEDEYIQQQIQAAILSAEQYLNRKIYADEDSLLDAADGDGIVINELIRAAVLLMLGHLYANREGVTNNQMTALPMGFTYLLQPYRIGMGI